MADLVITAASVVASSKARKDTTRKFGATVTAGVVVYLDGATDTWKVAAVTGVSAALTAQHGIAENGGASGQPAAVVLEDPEFTPGATLTEGVIYVLSAAGAISPSADLVSLDNVVILGAATNATKMVLKPIVSGGTVA